MTPLSPKLLSCFPLTCSPKLPLGRTYASGKHVEPVLDSSCWSQLPKLIPIFLFILRHLKNRDEWWWFCWRKGARLEGLTPWKSFIFFLGCVIYLHYFSSFSHQVYRESRCFYSYVTNKETELLKSLKTCPGHQNNQWGGWTRILSEVPASESL